MIARNVAAVISGLAVLIQAMLFNAAAVAGEMPQQAGKQSAAGKAENTAGRAEKTSPAIEPSKQVAQAKAVQAKPVQTEVAIQIKNLRLGMSTQEFAKEFPQVHLQQATQNTERWMQADIYADPGSLMGNCLAEALKKPCASLAIVGGAFMHGEFFFVDNQLSRASIILDIDDDLDVTSKKFYGLLDELSRKLNAKAEIAQQAQESLYAETPDATLRVVEWVNSSTKDKLVVKEDYYYSDPDGHTLDIEMVSGSYEIIMQGRKSRLEQLRKEEKLKKEAREKLSSK